MAADYTLKLTGGLPDVLPLVFSRGQDRTITVATGLDLTGATVQWAVKANDQQDDTAEITTLDNGVVGGITILAPASAGVISLTFPHALFANHTTYVAAPVPRLIQMAKAWLQGGSEINLWGGALSIHDFGIQSTTAPPLVSVSAPAITNVALGYYTNRMAPFTVPQHDSAATYFATVGARARLMHYFQDMINPSEPTAAPTDLFGTLRMAEVLANGASGVLPVISLSLDNSRVTPEQNQPTWSNASILAGTHDTVLATWCTQAAAWNHPMIVVPFWEMTGRWYPWAAGTNGNTPASFIAAYQYVFNFITSRVSLARMGWCPSIDIPTSNLIPLEQCYPGSAYVHVLCMNGYNKGPASSDQIGKYLSFEEVFRPTYNRLIALDDTLPICIVETGSVPGVGATDKAVWTAGIATALATMPRVHGVCLFSRLFGAQDYRIDSTPGDLTAFQTLAALSQMQGTFPTS